MLYVINIQKMKNYSIHYGTLQDKLKKNLEYSDIVIEM